MITITSELVIPSPLSSLPKRGLALHYPGRAPVHHCLSFHNTGEEFLLAKAQGPITTIPPKPGLLLEERIVIHVSLKSKREMRTAHY